jgi:hypothetical protein
MQPETKSTDVTYEDATLTVRDEKGRWQPESPGKRPEAPDCQRHFGVCRKREREPLKQLIEIRDNKKAPLVSRKRPPFFSAGG